MGSYIIAFAGVSYLQAMRNIQAVHNKTSMQKDLVILHGDPLGSELATSLVPRP